MVEEFQSSPEVIDVGAQAFASFEDVERSSIQNKSRSPRRPFTDEEDAIIIEQATKLKGKHWCEIAAQLENRTARQVRERWVNYLCPDVSHEAFTPEEDRKLENLMFQFPGKWSQIAKFFPKRTDVMLKNRGALLKRHLLKKHSSPYLQKRASLQIPLIKEIDFLQNKIEMNLSNQEPKIIMCTEDTPLISLEGIDASFFNSFEDEIDINTPSVCDAM